MGREISSGGLEDEHGRRSYFKRFLGALASGVATGRGLPRRGREALRLRLRRGVALGLAGVALVAGGLVACERSNDNSENVPTLDLPTRATTTSSPDARTITTTTTAVTIPSPTRTTTPKQPETTPTRPPTGQEDGGAKDSQDSIYVVEKGDTVWDLSVDTLKREGVDVGPADWAPVVRGIRRLSGDNPQIEKHPDLIHVGQEINTKGLRQFAEQLAAA